MNYLILPRPNADSVADVGKASLPSIITRADDSTRRRFLEFFLATIRNPNTRRAYFRACCGFLSWFEHHGGRSLQDVEPVHVAAWIEQLARPRTVTPGLAAPSVKQHLAAVRMLFDWLVTGQVVPVNPAWSVRGPSHVVKRGKTPVLSAQQARELLDSIPLTRRDPQMNITVDDLVGLRDRALIAVMLYSFSRIGAAVRMDVRDYWQNGKRWWLRLHEKGGKHHEVPCHHKAEEYLDAYLRATVISQVEARTPLFRTADRRTGRLTDRRMSTADVLRMVKRRIRLLALPRGTCCHSFRATGITAYLENGGTLEHAQAIAAHESPRTTKLYDRTTDAITLDEVERIVI